MNIRRTFLAHGRFDAGRLPLSPMLQVHPAEAAKLVRGKAVLVDCRAQGMAGIGVAAPAVLLSKSDFDGDQKQWKEFSRATASRSVYCRTGRRSGQIANALVEKGVKAANVGGLKDDRSRSPTRTVDTRKRMGRR
jgi:rhodanese-related sulfurtransferase